MQLDKIQSLENKLNSASIIERTNILCEIIDQRGSCSFYDEEITQLQHALQCATLAKENNESDKFITASLFHDLGHMLTGEDVNSHDFLNNDKYHENVAASFLSKYFPEEVTYPIKMHVIAKRYLCSVQSDYYDGLSDGSKRSFKLQGGYLNKDAIRKLESHKYFEDAVRLRNYDDKAKIKGKKTEAISFFHPFIKKSYI